MMKALMKKLRTIFFLSDMIYSIILDRFLAIIKKAEGFSLQPFVLRDNYDFTTSTGQGA